MRSQIFYNYKRQTLKLELKSLFYCLDVYRPNVFKVYFRIKPSNKHFIVDKFLWSFTNLIFTDDTASTDQHHAIYRRTQKKWGGGVTPPTPPL